MSLRATGGKKIEEFLTQIREVERLILRQELPVDGLIQFICSRLAGVLSGIETIYHLSPG